MRVIPQTEERPAGRRGDSEDQHNDQVELDSTTDRGYAVDGRGLHPDDSGFVYCVRVDGERKWWFKAPSGARARAKWLAEDGRPATVERYEISDRRVIETFTPDIQVSEDGGWHG